ncbi:MAG: hypothetical protein CFE31_01580 [Rhizobiales bacterium PAR1]|nr:MAG: hypothetical protein CFE31_01580 [Rhizobiales bacterium PAR1]
MSDIVTLEAERTRITDAIAALSPDLGRQLPGRKLPSAAGSKVDALNRQLATINLKIKQAKAKMG